MCFTKVRHKSIESNTLFSLKQEASVLTLLEFFKISTLKIA